MKPSRRVTPGPPRAPNSRGESPTVEFDWRRYIGEREEIIADFVEKDGGEEALRCRGFFHAQIQRVHSE